MRVRHGWSSEVAPNKWAKVDVELEEEDLRRLLHAAALTSQLDIIPVHLAFSLLAVEAEALLTTKLITSYGMKDDGRLAQLSGIKAEVYARVRDAL
jgi:hypothetical protein